MVNALIFCPNDSIFDNFFRLNTRFEFSELFNTPSDDNMIYKSPSISGSASAAGQSYFLSIDFKPTADVQPRSSSEFRKFSSEPSLSSNGRHSRCGFRDRLQSDCVEEDHTDHRHNTSDSHTDNSLHRVRTKRKHDCCQARQTRLKSYTKFRRPLSDCGARMNSSSPMIEAVAETTTSSLNEEEIKSVCVDVVLSR